MRTKLFFLSLLIIGILLLVVSYNVESTEADNVIIESFKTFTSDSVLIRGDVYIPREISKDSLIVFIHGFSGNRRYWKTMIMAFIHEGFVCLAFDLRGHGGSWGYMLRNISANYEKFEKDVIAAIRWVKNNVFLPEKVVLIGHSMGGGLAIYLGYKWSNVSIVVAIAPALFGDFLNRTNPKNILFMAGAKDNIIAPDYVKKLFNKSTGVYPNETFYVYEENGIVRGFYLNSIADHTTIVVDKDSVKTALNWVEKYLYSREVNDIEYIGYKEAFAHFLANVSAFLLVISIIPLLLPVLFSFSRKTTRELSYKEIGKYLMRSFIYPGFFAIFLYTLISAVMVIIPPFPIAHLILSALIANSLLMPLIFRRKVVETFKIALKEVRNISSKEILAGITVYLAFIVPFHIITFAFYQISLISSELRIAFVAIYTIILLPFFMIDEILFRGYVREKLGDKLPNVLGSIATYSLAKGFSLAVIGTLGVFVYYAVLYRILGGAIIPLTYAWICLILPDIFYHFSKNYKIAAIFNSLTVATMLAQVSATLILI